PIISYISRDYQNASPTFSLHCTQIISSHHHYYSIHINHPAPTQLYPLSLHDALPISASTTTIPFKSWIAFVPLININILYKTYQTRAISTPILNIFKRLNHPSSMFTHPFAHKISSRLIF